MSEGPVTMSMLYSIHSRHQQLCDIVLEADSCFGGFIFINFATVIPDICACIYDFILLDSDRHDTIIIVWWMCLVSGNFLFMAVSAAFLSNSAHGCFDALNNLAFRDLPALMQGKISIMLERINGPVIGFSCQGLFTITRGTLLNVLGVITTFFLTVLQIKVSNRQ
ncbi:uncharacterized protein [Centruroides vittatus]|uniref:uncharacterized protein n=1 Tax=Centruroides vittatus TaxID=120091 RepID=UPI00350F3A1A